MKPIVIGTKGFVIIIILYMLFLCLCFYLEWLWLESPNHDTQGEEMPNKVLVLGDRIVDEYMHCKATRLCPEAPAPVLVETSRWRKRCEGGASLVAENLKSLLYSDGGWGGHLIEIFGSESRKLRIFADRTLICRVDEDSLTVKETEEYKKQIADVIKGCEVVVVGDYGKGAMTHCASWLTKLCLSENIPLFVDAKSDPKPYTGCYAIFPNENEHTDLNEKCYQHVIRKRGPKGCSVDGTLVATEEQQVYDVTGAGDVFLAAFVARFLYHLNPPYRTMGIVHLTECAHYANKAAGISVRHLGTYIVKPEELK